MFTPLQEKILKTLIEALPKSAESAIDIRELSTRSMLQGAENELKEQGYIELFWNTKQDYGLARITDKGVNYFKEKLKQKYGEATMQKIELIDRSIKEANEVLNSRNADSIYERIEEIVGEYDSEINDIRKNLKMYNTFHIATSYDDFAIKETTKDYSSDLRLLIKLLEKLKADIFDKAEKRQTTSGGINIHNNPIFQPDFNNQVVVNIVTYEMVCDAVEQSKLSPDDKTMLNGMIAEIERLVKKKDKKTVWEKIKGAMGWIANKAVDVTLAATLVPYLAEVLKAIGS